MCKLPQMRGGSWRTVPQPFCCAVVAKVFTKCTRSPRVAVAKYLRSFCEDDIHMQSIVIIYHLYLVIKCPKMYFPFSFYPYFFIG